MVSITCNIFTLSSDNNELTACTALNYHTVSLGENQATLIKGTKIRLRSLWSENQTNQAFGSDIIQNTSMPGTENSTKGGIHLKTRH